MPHVDLKPLRELFRARVLSMLKTDGLINNAFIRKIRSGAILQDSAPTMARR